MVYEELVLRGLSATPLMGAFLHAWRWVTRVEVLVLESFCWFVVCFALLYTFVSKKVISAVSDISAVNFILE